MLFDSILNFINNKACVSSLRFASWTPEMANYYNELDPEMADVTMDDLIASFPEGANWYAFKYSPSRNFKMSSTSIQYRLNA